MDSKMMGRGDDKFEHMPEIYIITITDYDIFAKEGIVYNFANMCLEYPDLHYEDRLHFVDSLVSRVKNAEVVRGNYMTFGDVIDREKKESFEAGAEQGFIQSIANMPDNGKSPEEIAAFTGYNIDMIMLVKEGQN